MRDITATATLYIHMVGSSALSTSKSFSIPAAVSLLIMQIYQLYIQLVSLGNLTQVNRTQSISEM